MSKSTTGVKPTRLTDAMRKALLDLIDGRIIENRHWDWGGTLAPRDLPGKTCRNYLGNVKTVTIRALESRGWIEVTGKPTYHQFYNERAAIIYSITAAGRLVVESACK